MFRSRRSRLQYYLKAKEQGVLHRKVEVADLSEPRQGVGFRSGRNRLQIYLNAEEQASVVEGTGWRYTVSSDEEYLASGTGTDRFWIYLNAKE